MSAARPGVPPWLAYGLAFTGSIAAAAIGQWVTAAHLGGWYAALAKPQFTPPNAVFPIVWPILYALMAVAAGRILTLPAGTATRKRALIFYVAQLMLNVLWSVAFFERESPAAAC
jgi:benzodiazapine receptor